MQCQRESGWGLLWHPTSASLTPTHPPDSPSRSPSKVEVTEKTTTVLSNSSSPGGTVASSSREWGLGKGEERWVGWQGPPSLGLSGGVLWGPAQDKRKEPRGVNVSLSDRQQGIVISPMAWTLWLRLPSGS